MSIMHFSGTAHLAAESGPPFVLTHTMVAGLTTPLSGYDSIVGPIGTLTPNTIAGELCLRISQSTVTAELLISVTPGNLPRTLWDRMRFEASDGNWDGRQLNQADAIFTNGIFTEWRYTGEIPFVNGITYFLDWI